MFVPALVQTALYVDFFYHYFKAWKANKNLELPAPLQYAPPSHFDTACCSLDFLHVKHPGCDARLRHAGLNLHTCALTAKLSACVQVDSL